MTLVTVGHLKLYLLKNSAASKSTERNAVHSKQVFLIVDVSAFSGIQYLNILVESLEISHISYL